MSSKREQDSARTTGGKDVLGTTPESYNPDDFELGPGPPPCRDFAKSTTDVRGFRLGPNGTALGVGLPRSRPQPAASSGPAEVSPKIVIDDVQRDDERAIASKCQDRSPASGSIEDRAQALERVAEAKRPRATAGELAYQGAQPTATSQSNPPMVNPFDGVPRRAAQEHTTAPTPSILWRRTRARKRMLFVVLSSLVGGAASVSLVWTLLQRARSSEASSTASTSPSTADMPIPDLASKAVKNALKSASPTGPAPTPTERATGVTLAPGPTEHAPAAAPGSVTPPSPSKASEDEADRMFKAGARRLRPTPAASGASGSSGASGTKATSDRPAQQRDPVGEANAVWDK